MKYSNIHFARFIERESRFIVRCRLEVTGETVIAHLKNTGRGTEVLDYNALLAINYCPSPTRKTKYDLVGVKKGLDWYNIDSLAPNQVVADSLNQRLLQLPGLQGNLTMIKREVSFQKSRFDFYIETDQNETGFIEVKGMTLENQQIGAFPDAPTKRGLKHVQELICAQKQGYYCYVIFVAQFARLKVATINHEMQPALSKAIFDAMATGVQVLSYACSVSENELVIDHQVPFDLDTAFINPNRKGETI